MMQYDLIYHQDECIAIIDAVVIGIHFVKHGATQPTHFLTPNFYFLWHVLDNDLQKLTIKRGILIV